MIDEVEVVATIINVTNRRDGGSVTWTVDARIVNVVTRFSAEMALVGLPLRVEYAGYLLPRMSLRSGLLFRVGIPISVAEGALDAVAEGKEPVVACTATNVKSMAEPCVRVPLSLLKELRGQEARGERSRQALVRTWSEDRRTGKMSAKA